MAAPIPANFITDEGETVARNGGRESTSMKFDRIIRRTKKRSKKKKKRFILSVLGDVVVNYCNLCGPVARDGARATKGLENHEMKHLPLSASSPAGHLKTLADT